ncbi:MAG: hypothetical protein ACE5FW_03055 [Candidatus Aenigmatarchaeota archaeon]
MIAYAADLPHDRVWRINDRYDAPEQAELWEYGFNRQILVPGYTFPLDYERAEADGRIVVFKKMEGLAVNLGKLAQKWGH